MRLRIQTVSPLPDLKAWFIPDDPVAPQSINDLKNALITRIPALRDSDVRERDLVLLLDDFELLNDSPFGAVRDGDLVVLKRVVGRDAARTGRVGKRKRSESPEEELRPRRSVVRKASSPLKELNKMRYLRKVPKSDSPSESSSSSSSEEESESESESDSDSDDDAASSDSSSSSSTSSSSSSSSSSSVPTPQPSKPKLFKSLKPPQKPKPLPTPTRIIDENDHVPPGYGKPSTKSRNRRRRMKIKFEKEGKGGVEAPKGASVVNLVPLGTRNAATGDAMNVDQPAVPPAPAAASGEPAGEKQNEQDTQGEHWSNYHISGPVLMASLKNKNKKKGFKNAGTPSGPAKIVFTDSGAAIPVPSTTPAPGVSSSTTTPGPAASTTPAPAPAPTTTTTSAAPTPIPIPPTTKDLPRLIPPSELQSQGKIPHNMFVTSVDVEAGMWNHNQNQENESRAAKKKKRGKRREAERFQSGEWGTSWYAAEGGEGEGEEGGEGEEEEFVSASREVEDIVLSYGTPEAKGGFSWDVAESLWERGVVISSMEQLEKGKLVGWMALGINPTTFTPEILLTVARIIALDSASNKVTTRQILRPADGAALSFGLAGADGELEQDGEGMVEDDEDVDVQFEEVVEGKWRVLDC